MTGRCPEHLAPLLASLLDGKLTDEGRVALNRVLRDDAAARGYYARFMHTHALLLWRHGHARHLGHEHANNHLVAESHGDNATMSLVDDHDDVFSLLAHLQPPAEPLDLVELEPSRTADAHPAERIRGRSAVQQGESGSPAQRDTLLSIAGIHILRSDRRGADGAQPWRRLGRWSAAAAALLVGAALLVMFGSQPTDPDDSSQPAMVQDANQDDDRPVVGHRDMVVAHIAELHNAQWDQASTLRVGGELRRDGHFTLTEGYAQLMTRRGVTVVLEAPCQVQLMDEAAVRVTHGRLTAHVPPQGSGFAVHTPSAKVVDYGTEFGVDVDQAGNTAVQVYEGIVALDAINGDADVVDSRLLMPRQAVRVDRQSGAILEAVYQPYAYARSVEEGEYAYARAVMAMGPVAYWNFGHDDAGATVFNLADEQRHAKSSNVNFVPGRTGGWAGDFNGDDSIVVVESFDKRLTENFTLTAWIAPRTGGGHGWGRIVSYTNRQYSSAAIPGGWELGCNIDSRRDPGDAGEHNLFFQALTRQSRDDRYISRSPDRSIGYDGTWTHVAVTIGERRGDQQLVTWYLDGQQVHASYVRPGIADYEGRFVLGNWHPPTQEDDDRNRGFDGLIDDVAIFDRVLDDREISVLMQSSP